MRIGNARYCGALIYRNYLDTDDVIGCHLSVCVVVCVVVCVAVCVAVCVFD